MNRRLPALLAGVAMLQSAPSRAETLRDAVADALAGNPTLAAAQANQRALDEEPMQAQAGGRLTAAFDGPVGYDGLNYDKGGAATVSASLPIWTGGRVSSAVRAARGDVAAGAQGLRNTRAQLIYRVVGIYAELLFDQQSVAIANEDIALLDRQVGEARARFRLGKATRTDVAQLEAQLANAQATLAGAQTTLTASSADYRALVGHDPGRLAASADLDGLPTTIDDAENRALRNNPLYQRSQRLADAADARIGVARAARAPSITLTGSYGEGLSFTGGVADSYLASKSVGVTLHVPILTGGLVASQVRQANAQYSAARFDVAAAAREARRAADAAWASLTGTSARVIANKARVDAASLALRGVQAEYGFDLRTTLDVLLADETLRSAQLALARSRSDHLEAQAAVLLAAGSLEIGAFVED